MLARSNAELLQDEIVKLDEWLNTQQFHAVYENILRIRKKLQSAINKGYHLSSYLQEASAVNEVLANPDDDYAREKLHACAERASGAASPERMAWGRALMGLGIILLVLSLLTMSCLLACSFPLSGFFLLLGGAVSFTISISFFRAGRQQGMSKDLDAVAGTHFKLT